MKKGKETALDPIVISKIMHKILERNTKLSFVVNRNLWATILFTKWLPKRWVDKILYKQLF